MPEINAMEPNSGVIVIYDNLSLFTFLSSDERIETVCCLICLKSNLVNLMQMVSVFNYLDNNWSDHQEICICKIEVKTG